MEGFELEVLDYLLKPFSFERFFQAIQRAKDAIKIDSEEEHVFLKADKKSFKVSLNKILYIEAMGDFLKVFIQDHKTLVVSDTIKNMKNSLPSSKFIQIHKSYIISSSHIDFVEANRISISGEMLPIGLAFRDRVREYLGIKKEK